MNRRSFFGLLAGATVAITAGPVGPIGPQYQRDPSFALMYPEFSCKVVG